MVKFNNGDYQGANNQEDDLAIIAEKIPYRADDYSPTTSTTNLTNSTVLVTSGNAATGSGIIETTSDVDAFSFTSAPGPITITVKPVASSQHSFGNNLDVKIQLLSSTGVVLASADPSGSTSATITYGSCCRGRTTLL